MRGPNITPDWERPGTEIVGMGAFNATFALSGTMADVPELASLMLLGAGLLCLTLRRRPLN